MYGLINKLVAVPGQRDALIALVLEAGEMPGCISYVVAKDAADENAVWVTEVWNSEASHKASLDIPEVKAAIGRAGPLIAGVEKGPVTVPVGGIGLSEQMDPAVG